MTRRQVAVVGSGVAGLTAAYVLQREADVTLFEADSRLGGHAHTHDLVADRSESVGVDSGFIVHNEKTYPTLLRLFAELDVATQPSEMSLSVSCGGCGLEYAGARGISGLFPTGRNLLRGRYLYLLSEVPRFHRRARALLAAGPQVGTDETVAEFLARGHFSSYFVTHFFTPVISAVWSCSPELALRYPARYLFQFLDNHGMLSVTGSPEWRTVTGGSARYVEKAAKQLTAVLTNTPVREIRRAGGGVQIRDDADDLRHFDGVVVAVHPGQALKMLVDPTPLQRNTLSALPYSRNTTVLHTDTSVLPRATRAQASWNYYLPDCRSQASAVKVSYDMNRLQSLPGSRHYLVTLNGENSVDATQVIATMDYEHPIFTPESVAAQSQLPLISDETVAFAGAYHGWGFHEDGCLSGLKAAANLGVRW